MATCPSCQSARLRSGYRKTPLVLRAVGVRTLLCDSCNCEFRAFSPLPPKRTRHRSSKADVFNQAPAVDLKTIGSPSAQSAQRQRQPVKFDRATLPSNGAATLVMPQPVKETPDELRRRITISAAPAAPTEEPLMKLREEMEARRQAAANHVCPHCDSLITKRRHRKGWEKLLLGWTSWRPYLCSDCGASFHARRQEKHASAVLSRQEADFVKSSCFNQEREGQDT
jgi:hypothetical protein